jgi:O-methyltransferase involved in polyketide biosynthesis
MQVRTRLLDDAVRNFIDAGGRQLVLLGAGFDCRALRMPELDCAQVFEVDHPATQTH